MQASHSVWDRFAMRKERMARDHERSENNSSRTFPFYFFLRGNFLRVWKNYHDSQLQITNLLSVTKIIMTLSYTTVNPSDEWLDFQICWVPVSSRCWLQKSSWLLRIYIKQVTVTYLGSHQSSWWPNWEGILPSKVPVHSYTETPGKPIPVFQEHFR